MPMAKTEFLYKSRVRLADTTSATGRSGQRD